MDEKTIPIARAVLTDLYEYEQQKETPDPNQLEAITRVLSQLGSVHRIWFGA